MHESLKTSSFAKRCHSQFSILITTCLVVAARCSWQFPQTPWCQLQRFQAPQWILKSHAPLLRLSQRLRRLGSFNGPLLSNLKNIVNRMLLIMRFQQVEEVFSIPRKILRVCLNVLGLGQTTWERNYLSWGLLHVTCHIFPLTLFILTNKAPPTMRLFWLSGLI